MDVWHIVLEEGFRDDDVALRVDGDDLYADTDISTHRLLGYAASFEASMAAGSRVTVEVPTRSLACDFVVPDSPARQLVVSIVDGVLQFLTPEHARGYA